MTDKELDKFSEQETSWLAYYGHRQSRQVEEFGDANFYDRLDSIGYTKKNLPLDSRCPATFITSKAPVLESDTLSLLTISGPRNHEANIFTPLEYVLAKKTGRYVEFINILKTT